MKDAWHVIKQDNSVSYTIDLFKMGILVINRTKEIKTVHTRYFLAR